MRQYYGVAATAVIALTLSAVACDNGPKNPVDTGLCGQPGSSISCPVSGTSANFEVTLVSTSCTAKGTTITVTEPVNRKLTSDACYESSGKSWTIASSTGGFPTGTQLNFTITSDQTSSAPSFRLTEVTPATEWTIAFEDGGDVDFNDVVLDVKAVTP